MTQDNRGLWLYTNHIQGLLYLDSPNEILRGIREMRDLDVATYYQALASLEENALKEGRPAKHQLLLFVHNIIDEAVRPQNQQDQVVENTNVITTTDELLQRALAAPDFVHVYALLRDYKRLFNKDTFDTLQLQLSKDSLQHQLSYAKLRVCCVMSLLLGDKACAAYGHLHWASYCRSEQQYDRGLRHIVHAATLVEGINDVVLQTGIFGTLARFYEETGATEEAVKCLEHALEIARHGDNKGIANTVREKLTTLYQRTGHYVEALALIDENIQQLEKLEDKATNHSLKASLLAKLGRFDEAEAEYYTVVALAEKLGDHSRQFRALVSIGLSLLSRDNAAQAVEHFKNLLKLVEPWGDTVRVASVRNNLGNALLQAGRLSEAETEFANAWFIKLDAGDWHGEAISLLGLGDTLHASGQIDEAQKYYTLALVPILNQVRTGDDTDLSLYALRVLNGKVKEKDEGVNAFVEGLNAARTKGDIARGLLYTQVLGEWLVHQGQEQKAIEMYRETLKSCAEQKIASPQIVRLQVALAQLLVSREDGRQEAYQLLTDAVATIENEIPLTIVNRRRAEIVAQWIDLYGTLIKLLVEHGESLQLSSTNDAVDAATLAFNLHEAAKARTFNANMANASMAQPAVIPQGLREREMELLQLAQEYQNEESVQAERFASFRFERLREIDAQLQTYWQEMQTYAPEYVRLRSGEPATLADVRSLLSQQSTPSIAFVSFFCNNDSTTCFVMRSDEQHLYIFRCAVGRQQLQDVAKRLRSAFKGDRGNPKQFRSRTLNPIDPGQPWKRDLSFFEELNTELLQFLPAVQGVDLLCIAPHGPLHLLPLHALRTPDGAFLVDQHAVIYCPSFSTLRYCLARGVDEESSSTQAKPSVYIAGVADRENLHPEYFEDDEQIFDPQAWQITMDMGIAATKQRALERIGNYDVVHLTCHGYFDQQDPLNSGLLLSNGQERPTKKVSIEDFPVLERLDYLLTARDILRTPMRAHIVTLRACATGIQGERNTGDELEGLSRSLLYVGNAAIMVSLWEVDQQSSRQLISSFYRYWTEVKHSTQPVEKWRALWKAQKDFLNAKEEPFLGHPYHWAPFILIGDWR